ncbi:MAG: DUF2272 domain-containing protein [Stellaceae bacterium]
MLTRQLGRLGLVLALALGGCEAVAPLAGPTPAAQPDDAHIPPFARWPYQRFSREAAVQIALREWRAFGSTVVYPNQELPFDAERSEGLWQRVGEYWWLGLPMGAKDQGFTGMHNENGQVFPASQDGNYAWSAAFIDYVMRMAGAGHRFPYSPTHADYINAARDRSAGQRSDVAISARRPERYAPRVGDLICMWRGRRQIRFDDLPVDRFPGHCDIVVAIHQGSLDGIGGNVDNTVGMWQVPLAADGHLVQPDGTVVDPDHPWFVVIRVEYDINGSSPPTS